MNLILEQWQGAWGLGVRPSPPPENKQRQNKTKRNKEDKVKKEKKKEINDFDATDAI